MESYTNLEQSKKLAEILPIESADMYWFNRHIDLTETKYEVFVIKSYAIAFDDNEIIPCWSLAALLSVIPQEIFGGEYVINITEGCDNRWVLTYDSYWNRNHSIYGLSSGADNLVDACYKMILKLNERKLL